MAAIEMINNLEYLRSKINQTYLANESLLVNDLLGFLGDYDSSAIQQTAKLLVTTIRAKKDQQTLVESFLHEYELNSEEGIVLMGIAEALLRIPDHSTQDLFLQEKLTEADWHKHLQHSDSLLVNFATRALDISGLFERQFDVSNSEHQMIFSKVVSRIGLPLIRSALKQAMQQLAYQFVIAETIEQATTQASQQSNYLYSFDMLGEAALTDSDVTCYFKAYSMAIEHLAGYATHQDLYKNPSISIKLSALYSRYEPLQHKIAVQQITRKLVFLAKKARLANITVIVDAEETERLEMSLDIFKQVITDSALIGWSGFGIAVQAYQKRAISTLQWLAALAKSLCCTIPVRLVKGAYWDSEIKRAQVNGLIDYPVFTHKIATDISYLACAKVMISHFDTIYPQFATHNAQSVAAILELGNTHPGYEFQRLHGMGEALYNQLLKQTEGSIPCRIYAPVGQYQALLPYLVRRLLENGVNTSFINQVENSGFSIEKVIADPVIQFKKSPKLANPIVLPKDILGKQRVNSEGINLADLKVLNLLQQDLQQFKTQTWQAAPIVNGMIFEGPKHTLYNPADSQQVLGSVIYSNQKIIEEAIDTAAIAFKKWRLLAVHQRADCLYKAADLLEKNRVELISLSVREAGKTIKDALAEIREAVDFCRYYAQSAIELFEQPLTLPGPTGEKNLLYQYGRGVFVCISPWNFPIAIFLGQVTAALVSGNTVIAKPATLTPLTAMRCIQILYQAGIPKDVLHFLPGEGTSIGRYFLTDERIAGVVFTGSLSTAQTINQQLSKHSEIIPFIAETGGQNVMIADSSAHIEQLVQDVVQSAFNSAGQRCSALRVLFIPEPVADKIIEKIKGVMQQLIIADPHDYQTDLGPVISENSALQLNQHIEAMKKQAKTFFQVKLEKQWRSPCFVPPTLIEISSLSELKKENFGPILHVIRYHPSEIDNVLASVNESGYGLTLGIHSRIKSTINRLVKNAKVGNIYVNRNMIGAVVGIQPFGGMGLSGTGPKAGGPHYLLGFSCEQTVSTNTAAIGANTELLTQY